MRKRQWKKILSLLLALAMVFTMNTSVFADPLVDDAAPAPAVEETAPEAPVAEEPAAEAPKTEEPAAEAPAADETPAPAAEEPAPAAEEPAAEAPKAEEPAAEAPKTETEEIVGTAFEEGEEIDTALKALGWTLSGSGIDAAWAPSAKKLTINDATSATIDGDYSVDGYTPITLVVKANKSISISPNAYALVANSDELTQGAITDTNDVEAVLYAYNGTAVDAKYFIESVADSDVGGKPVCKTGVELYVESSTPHTKVAPEDIAVATQYIALTSVSASLITPTWDKQADPTGVSATLSGNQEAINISVTSSIATDDKIEIHVSENATGEEASIPRSETAETSLLENVAANTYEGSIPVKAGHSYVIYARSQKTDDMFSSEWVKQSEAKIVVGITPGELEDAVVKKIGKTKATLSTNYTNDVYFRISENKGDSWKPEAPKGSDTTNWTQFDAAEKNITTGLAAGKEYKVWGTSGNGTGSGRKWSDPKVIATIKTVSNYVYRITSANDAEATEVYLTDNKTKIKDLFDVTVEAIVGPNNERESVSTSDVSEEPNGLLAVYTPGNLKADDTTIGATTTPLNLPATAKDFVIDTAANIDLGSGEGTAVPEGTLPVLTAKKSPTTVHALGAYGVENPKQLTNVNFVLIDSITGEWIWDDESYPFEVTSTNNTKAYKSFLVDDKEIVSTNNTYAAGTHKIKASSTASANIITVTNVSVRLTARRELVDAEDEGATFTVSATKDDKATLAIAVPNGIQYGEDYEEGALAYGEEEFTSIVPTFTLNGAAEKGYSLRFAFTTSADRAAKVSDDSAPSKSAFWDIADTGDPEHDSKYDKNLYEYNAGEKVYVIAQAVQGAKVVHAKAEVTIQPRDLDIVVNNTSDFVFDRNKKPSADKLSSNSTSGISANESIANFHYDVLGTKVVGTVLTQSSDGIAYKVNDTKVDYSTPGQYDVPATGFTFVNDDVKKNYNIKSAVLHWLIVKGTYYATFVVYDNGKPTTLSTCKIDENTKKPEGWTVKGYTGMFSFMPSANGLISGTKSIDHWQAVPTDNSDSFRFDVAGAGTLTENPDQLPGDVDYTVYAVVKAAATKNGDITVTSILPVVFDGRAHVVPGGVKHKDDKSYSNALKSKVDDLGFEIYDESRSNRLYLGTDYSVSYKNGNKNASVYYDENGVIKQINEAKRPYVQVKGKGNYKTLDIKVYYDILPNNLYNLEYSASYYGDDTYGDNQWMLSRPYFTKKPNDVYVLAKNKKTIKLNYKVAVEARNYYGKNKKITLKAAKTTKKGTTGDYKQLIYKYVSENNGWTLQDKGVDGVGDYLLVIEGINNYAGKFTEGYANYADFDNEAGKDKPDDTSFIADESYYDEAYQFKVVDNTGIDVSKAKLKFSKKTLDWTEKGISANDFGPSLSYKGKTITIGKSTLAGYGVNVTYDAGSYTLTVYPKQAGYYGIKSATVKIKGKKLKKSDVYLQYSEDNEKTWSKYSKALPYKEAGYALTVSSTTLKVSECGAIGSKQYATAPRTYPWEVWGSRQYAGSKVILKYKINKGKLSDAMDKAIIVSMDSPSVNVGGTYPTINLSANGSSVKLVFDGANSRYKGYWNGNIGYYSHYLDKKGAVNVEIGGCTYTFKPSKNTSAGTGKMTITATAYTGKATKDFTIKAWENMTKIYDRYTNPVGERAHYGDLVSEVGDVKDNAKGVYKPKVVIYQKTTGGALKALKAGKDYDKNIVIPTSVNKPGVNTISVNGSTNNFKFKKDTPSNSVWSIYTDAAKKMTITVSNEAYQSGDYYADKRRFDNGEVEEKQPVVPVKQDGTKISTTYCGGQSVCPRVEKIEVNGKTYTLSENAYEVDYINNYKVGTGTIIVKMKQAPMKDGKYPAYDVGGKKTFKFKINPAEKESVVLEK